MASIEGYQVIKPCGRGQIFHIQGSQIQTIIFMVGPHTLRKRDVIVVAFSARVRKFSHKYRIELPISTAKATLIELENGNIFWVYAVQK